MIIFRVESGDGVGPYVGADWAIHGDWIREKWSHTAENGFPEPQEDLGRRIKRSEVCAFKSIAQLRRWFNKPLRKLLPGFKVGVYCVADESVSIGEKQVLVKKKVMEPLYDLDIISLEPVF